MMQANNKELYIRISEFGYNHPEGFTITELKNTLNLKEWEYNIVHEYEDNALRNADQGGNMNPSRSTIFVKIGTRKENDNQGNPIHDSAENPYFILNYEAYYNYINYLDLQESKKISKIAFVVSIISIFLSVLFSWWQIYSSVSIDEVQIQSIKDDINSVDKNIQTIKNVKFDQEQFQDIKNIIDSIKKSESVVSE